MDLMPLKNKSVSIYTVNILRDPQSLIRQYQM